MHVSSEHRGTLGEGDAWRDAGQLPLIIPKPSNDPFVSVASALRNPWATLNGSCHV